MVVQDDEPGDPTVEPDLGERPVGNKLARDVARARIAQELFAVDRQVKLGRYHVLEMVGAGGMGVVWGAWDPELERRVAIKLVAATQSSARDRIVREGQALAKLSHPNVVPVYDVGVVEPDVYIVMEWVSGKNLRKYCSEPRTVADIVAVYRDAGRGLAAAHHAGLIHRDFKPDNAIRGDDGRVRVLDFGLARADLVDDSAGGPGSTRGAGTPKYMAPEQADGSAVTAAVDQYAFCVSLREALVGRRADGTDADVPGWLAEIVAHGTAEVAADRFVSMDVLLAALARDPATVWRRRIIAAVAVGAVGAAFAIGSLRNRSDDAICTGGADEIAGSWNDATRGKLRTHLEGLGPYAVGEAPRIDGQLGGYASAWASAHDHACLAEQHAELTPQLYERTLGCLGRSRAALDTAIGVLSTAPVEGLGNAIIAAHGLPDPDRCATDTRASKVAPPPRESATAVARLETDVARARVLAAALDPSAVPTAKAIVDQAARLNYTPLIAHANLAYGLALTKSRATERAVAPLALAVDAAIDADDDMAFVEAYAREVYAVGVTGSGAKVAVKPLGLLPYAERIANRPGAGGPLARARLYNDVGTAYKAADDLAATLLWWKRAVAEAKLAGHEVELADIPGNLAKVVDEPERSRLAAVKVAEYTASLGPDHPSTLRARLGAAMLVSDPLAAASELRTTCRRLQQLHPHLHDVVAQYLYELGWLAEERGDIDEAKASFTTVRNPDDASVGYLQLLDGKLDDAAAAMIELATKQEHAHDWWNRVLAADAFLVAAISWHRVGRDSDAASALSRGVAILDAIDDHQPAYARRLARQRAMLARLVAKTDPKRAKDLAALAARWYRAANGYDAVAAEMQAIMDSR